MKLLTAILFATSLFAEPKQCYNISGITYTIEPGPTSQKIDFPPCAVVLPQDNWVCTAADFTRPVQIHLTSTSRVLFLSVHEGAKTHDEIHWQCVRRDLK